MTPTPAGQALLNAFGQIMIINLRNRADRRRDIGRELAKLGLSLDHPQVHLFEAIRPQDAQGFPSVGARGAFLSHQAVCERMLDRGWPRMLVLEDDMTLPDRRIEHLRALATALCNRPWDILYGHPGARPAQVGPAQPQDPPPDPPADEYGLITLPAERPMIQLHFLGLSRAAAQRIVPELAAMQARPEGSPQGGPMHVDGALNWIRRANPDLIALAASPAVSMQRASRSDIAALRWFDRTPGVSALVALVRRLRA